MALERLKRLLRGKPKEGLPQVEVPDPKFVPEDEGDLDSKSAREHRSETSRLRVKEES